LTDHERPRKRAKAPSTKDAPQVKPQLGPSRSATQSRRGAQTTRKRQETESDDEDDEDDEDSEDDEDEEDKRFTLNEEWIQADAVFPRAYGVKEAFLRIAQSYRRSIRMASNAAWCLANLLRSTSLTSSVPKRSCPLHTPSSNPSPSLRTGRNMDFWVHEKWPRTRLQICAYGCRCMSTTRRSLRGRDATRTLPAQIA